MTTTVSVENRSIDYDEIDDLARFIRYGVVINDVEQRYHSLLVMKRGDIVV